MSSSCESRRPDRVGSSLALRLGLGVLLALAAGCGIGAPRVPQLPAWDDVEYAPLSAEADEIVLWDKARSDLDDLFDSEHHFEDPTLEAYLSEIVARLTPPIAAAGPKLRFLVISDVQRNAYAIPDGTLLIALPLLVSLENEAQLASILAHEIVHVTRRHALLSTRYDAMTSSHVERMRMSRRMETEADRGAIQLMVAAGYDPRESLSALRHLHETVPKDAERVRAWSSHEDLPFRTAELRRAIALLGTKESQRHAERFQEAMDCCRLQAVLLELDARQIGAALGLVNQHIERLPRSGAGYTLRARVLREMWPADRFSDSIREDLERGVEYGPNDPDSLRALGLFLRDTREIARSNDLLRRYLAARPDAYDRKIVERYVGESAP